MVEPRKFSEDRVVWRIQNFRMLNSKSVHDGKGQEMCNIINFLKVLAYQP